MTKQGMKALKQEPVREKIYWLEAGIKWCKEMLAACNNFEQTNKTAQELIAKSQRNLVTFETELRKIKN